MPRGVYDRGNIKPKNKRADRLKAYNAAIIKLMKDHDCTRKEAAAMYRAGSNGDGEHTVVIPAPPGQSFTPEQLQMRPDLVQQLVAFNVARLNKVISDAEAERTAWQKMVPAEEINESPHGTAAREFAGRH